MWLFFVWSIKLGKLSNIHLQSVQGYFLVAVHFVICFWHSSCDINSSPHFKQFGIWKENFNNLIIFNLKGNQLKFENHNFLTMWFLFVCWIKLSILSKIFVQSLQLNVVIALHVFLWLCNVLFYPNSIIHLPHTND